MKTWDPVVWLRATAYLAVAGVGLSLWLNHADHPGVVAAGLVVFAAGLPIYRFFRWKDRDWRFPILLFEAALVMVLAFVTNHAGTVIVLFFVLIPASVGLPLGQRVVTYVLFPLLSCLPFLLEARFQSGWSDVATLVPGFLAAAAFSEGFWKLRTTVLENQHLIDSLVEAQKQLNPGPVPPPTTPFTRREGEVLALVAKGYTNKEIADRLFLAEGTVKNRVSDILEKFQVRDRTQAALRAREMGLL